MARALGVGAATGLRSMTGPAAAARGTRWRWVLPVAALGEYVVDKLPQTPARTIPASLIVRAVLGGASGASVAGAGERVICAVLGAAGAIGASYAGTAYRERAKAAGASTVAALVEDGVAIGLAWAATPAASRG